MNLPFAKMHGLGNDFVVIDATRAPVRELLRAPSPALLRRLTDRRFGVGCDQVLLVEPPPDAEVDFGYRIFNSDGSEVGQCGNGSRCLARYVREHGLSDKRELRVKTSTSLLELQLLDDGLVRVNMGAPRFAPAQIPMIVEGGQSSPEYSLTLADGTALACGAVSMGNPHAVIEVADVDAAPVEAIGEELQRHPAFPERVNVGFVQFVDSGHVRLRVYERGAGETPGCGSGACAALVIGRLWGKLAASAAVHVRGGILRLQWGGADEPVWMTGPAETVFEGSLEWSK